MLFTGGAENKDVIQVYIHAPHQVREQQVHEILECSRCVGQTNWNHYVLILPLWCKKGHFILIAFTYANLVVSMAQADRAEDSSLAQVIKQVCNMRNWECIKLCLMI